MFSHATRSGLQLNNSLVSVIIPVHNTEITLNACLTSLQVHGGNNIEIIVVDDGCTDDSILHARRFGAQVIRTGVRIGPARARNLASSAAKGSILVFLDSDVCIHADTIQRIRDSFASDPDLAALIGSYDDAPAAPGFVSQYRNLLHYYMHQKGHATASTFWAGCGAIRADVFEEFGGFAAAYDHPSVEDIELGYRLRANGQKILLDRNLQVKHLKRWRLGKMLKTDIVRRGIPWTRLILRDRQMPNDLNLRLDQRFSVALVYLAVLLLLISAAPLLLPLPEHFALWFRYLSLLAAVAVLALNMPFYAFLLRKRGVLTTVAALPLHFAYFLCNGMSFLAGVAIYSHFRRKPARAARSNKSGSLTASATQIRKKFGTDG